MQFRVNIHAVNDQCNRMDNVETVISDIEHKLQEVSDGVSGVSLAEVRPAIDTLIASLAKNRGRISELKEALNSITRLYYQAEDAIKKTRILGNNITVYDLGKEIKSDDYFDLAEQYGLSDTAIRYLQDYHPDLLEELLNTSNPEDVMNKINDIFDKDHISMMEDCGYAYEAIKYLKENCPGMIGALYATSQWSQSDVKKVREAIYELCHENDICVYDPDYDFDSYNFDPNNSAAWAEENSIQNHTNCYAYAFGLTHDPRTGEMFPIRGLQPGYLSGMQEDFKNNYFTIYSRTDGGEKLVEYITADAEAVDLNFVPYEEGMTGGQRVALVINPVDDADGIADYHWYFYDEA